MSDSCASYFFQRILFWNCLFFFLFISSSHVQQEKNFITFFSSSYLSSKALRFAIFKSSSIFSLNSFIFLSKFSHVSIIFWYAMQPRQMYYLHGSICWFVRLIATTQYMTVIRLHSRRRRVSPNYGLGEFLVVFSVSLSLGISPDG